MNRLNQQRGTMATGSERGVGIRVAGIIALMFGLLTIAAGGRALFGGEEARAAVGDAVPFVLWFNFTAGFAYLAAGTGLLIRAPWAAWLSVAIAVATVAVFVAFGIHILLGDAYEMRTIGAMPLRSVVWIGIAILAWRIPKRMNQDRDRHDWRYNE